MVSPVEEPTEGFGVGPFQIDLLGFGFREAVVERSAKVLRVCAYVALVYKHRLFLAISVENIDSHSRTTSPRI